MSFDVQSLVSTAWSAFMHMSVCDFVCTSRAQGTRETAWRSRTTARRTSHGATRQRSCLRDSANLSDSPRPTHDMTDSWPQNIFATILPNLGTIRKFTIMTCPNSKSKDYRWVSIQAIPVYKLNSYPGLPAIGGAEVCCPAAPFHVSHDDGSNVWSPFGDKIG